MDDPSARIKPIDAGEIRKKEILETAVIILGAIVIIGIIVAIAENNKSFFIPQINFSTPAPTTNVNPPPSKIVITEHQALTHAIEIPPYGSAKLLFAVEHGVKRPEVLILELSGSEVKPVKVPIKAPFGKSTGRSNFDY